MQLSGSDLLSEITAAEYSDFLLLAPHYDDVALSLGGFLSEVQPTIRFHTIICYGVSRHAPFRQCTNAADITMLRQSEESAFWSDVGGSFSVIPNQEFSGFSGDLIGVFDKALSCPRSTLVFAPAGVGKHPDHLALNAVGALLARMRPVAFFEDLPYACGMVNYGYSIDGVKPCEVLAHFDEGHLMKKIRRMTEHYPSQGLGRVAEALRGHACQLSRRRGHFAERLWVVKC
jgi:hypothetical protein